LVKGSPKGGPFLIINYKVQGSLMGLFKSPHDKDGKGPGITLLQGLLILAVLGIVGWLISSYFGS
jgi:hypothetical protein|tara:strand:- start:44953 stop:45147 length:195 start_codon:yes stop_codon:yes gene_type:complete